MCVTGSFLFTPLFYDHDSTPYNCLDLAIGIFRPRPLLTREQAPRVNHHRSVFLARLVRVPRHSRHCDRGHKYGHAQ